MSTNFIIKASAITAIGFLGLAASSTANAQTRYGNVYDYERGHNCGSACTGPAVIAQPPGYYGAQEQIVVSPGPVYADCAVVQGMNCGAPAVTYTPPVTTGYSHTTSYSSGAAQCPAGTTMQADNTCLQSGGSSYGSTSSYSSTTTYDSSMSSATQCPAGTSMQSDGTCLTTSTSVYTGGTATVYSGDAASTGYTTNSYTTTDYLPIRK